MADFDADTRPGLYDNIGEVQKNGSRNGDVLVQPTPIITLVTVYTMRGYDTVLMKHVYWESDEVDDDASEYTTPADISLPSIVVFRLQGT